MKKMSPHEAANAWHVAKMVAKHKAPDKVYDKYDLGKAYLKNIRAYEKREMAGKCQKTSTGIVREVNKKREAEV